MDASTEGRCERLMGGGGGGREGSKQKTAERMG